VEKKDGEKIKTQIVMCLPCCRFEYDFIVTDNDNSNNNNTLYDNNNTTTSSSRRVNRGVARDRFVLKQIEIAKALSMQEPTSNASPFDPSLLLLTEVFETQEGNVEQINDAVAQCIGINKNQHISSKIGYRYTYNKEGNKRERGRPTIVRLDDLTDKEVKSRTGFTSVCSMIFDKMH
jgi:hypothetical protein